MTKASKAALIVIAGLVTNAPRPTPRRSINAIPVIPAVNWKTKHGTVRFLMMFSI
ncbi:MAG: hypothetical protein ACW97W_16880 [Candidatus Hodarchaeales archaeon]